MEGEYPSSGDCALFIDSQSQKANAARELDWTKIYWENTFCISSLYTDLGWDIMKGLSAYQSFFQDGVGYFAFPSAQDVFRLWESIGDFQLPNPKYKEFFATSFAPYFQGTDSFDACYDSFCNRLFLYGNE